jgi:hypothetical protein
VSATGPIIFFPSRRSLSTGLVEIRLTSCTSHPVFRERRPILVRAFAGIQGPEDVRLIIKPFQTRITRSRRLFAKSMANIPGTLPSR